MHTPESTARLRPTAILVCTLASLLCAAATAAAETPEPDRSIVYKSLNLIRYNPLGLQSENQLLYRLALSDSDHILLRDTYLAFGPQVMVSPSLQRVGARVHVKPLAILELFGLVEYIWFLGNFDYVTSYPDATADYSPDRLKSGADNGENYSATGLSVALSARLQIKIKGIALRSTTRMNRYWMGTRSADPVWYDIYWDLLGPRRGWMMLQDNDVLWVKGRLVVGLRHTWTRSWLPEAATAPLAADAPRHDSTHRVGPLVAYRLVDDDKYADKPYRRPTLLVLAQWWAAHPYRAGQQVSQAVPWLIVALAFNGRLDSASPVPAT